MSHQTQITIVLGVLLATIGLVVFGRGLNQLGIRLSTRLKLYAAWLTFVVILSLGYR